MITGWKRTAPLNMASAVGARSAAAPQISAGEVEMLHARISQRVVERGFCPQLPVLVLVLVSAREAKGGEAGPVPSQRPAAMQPATADAPALMTRRAGKAPRP